MQNMMRWNEENLKNQEKLMKNQELRLIGLKAGSLDINWQSLFACCFELNLFLVSLYNQCENEFTFFDDMSTQSLKL